MAGEKQENRYLGWPNPQDLIREKARLEKERLGKTSSRKLATINAEIDQITAAIEIKVRAQAGAALPASTIAPSRNVTPPPAPSAPPAPGRGTMGPVGVELEAALDAE